MSKTKFPIGAVVVANQDLFTPLNTLKIKAGTRGVVTKQQSGKFYAPVVWVRFDGETEEVRPYESLLDEVG